MDQREWGLLRETVVRRTQASGASREDAEDATHDALLAAIGQPQHPRSQVAWLSTVAQRRRVDLIRYRAREQRMSGLDPGAGDPTVAGPEDVVVDRAHASWLAASLTQLPATTREVVDAVGAGMAPAEVARSMNLSSRSVESHLTRARRHLRRMGALAVPLGVLLGWVVRVRAGSRVAPAAMIVAVPVVATVVALLPSSGPLDARSGAAPAPGAALPAPAELAPAPRGGTPVAGPAGPAADPDGTDADGGPPASAVRLPAPGGAAAAAGGAGSRAPARPRPAPVAPHDRALPTPHCALHLPVLAELGCVLSDLVGGLVHGGQSLTEQLPAPSLPVR